MLNSSIWNTLVENLDQETDPQTFWKTIKKLQGNTTKIKATYLKDHQNQKIYDNKQKYKKNRKY